MDLTGALQRPAAIRPDSGEVRRPGSGDHGRTHRRGQAATALGYDGSSMMVNLSSVCVAVEVQVMLALSCSKRGLCTCRSKVTVAEARVLAVGCLELLRVVLVLGKADPEMWWKSTAPKLGRCSEKREPPSELKA